MSLARDRAILREMSRRSGYFNGLFGGFPEQKAAVLDQSQLKCYRTPRRAGKTIAAIGGDIVADALANPDRNWSYAYVALTRASARGIAWNMLKKLNRQFDLRMHFVESQLRIVMPGGTEIGLHGADKTGWLDRLLGHEFRKVVVDEAGFYSIDLEKFYQEIRPTVLGPGGSLVFCSTPGHIPRGFYYDMTTGRVPGASLHTWPALSNPAMRVQIQKEIDQIRAADPDYLSRAYFRRNFLGEWVTEFKNKVYNFDADKHGCQSIPGEPNRWRYILGIDFGWYDATAFVVIGYHPEEPQLYVLDSYNETEMRLDKIASWVNMYRDQYKDLTIVGDPQHKQAFEEIRRRYQIPIIPADKTAKEDWVAIINSDYDQGHILVRDPASSPYAEQATQLSWHLKTDGTKVEAPGQPNDCCDAFMYAYKAAYHYRHEKPALEPTFQSREYYDRMSDRLEEEAEEMHRRNAAFCDASEWMRR